MANNRLYICDPNDGSLFFLAKSNAPEGWRMVCTPADFDAWARGRDLAAVEGGPSELVLMDEAEEAP